VSQLRRAVDATAVADAKWVWEVLGMKGLCDYCDANTVNGVLVHERDCPLSQLPMVDEFNTTEYRPHERSAEASELGLRPGHWPGKLHTNLGNGMPLMLSGSRDDGQIAIYHQANGCLKLAVYND